MNQCFWFKIGFVCWVGLLTMAAPSQAFVAPSQLNSTELERVESVLKNEVRAELSAHLEENLIQVAHSAVGDPTFGGLLMGDPMSAETRAVLTDGLYQILAASLIREGVTLDRRRFDSVVSSILEYSTRLGVFPSALTVGWMGRAQAGLGGSMGSQFNLYFDHGAVKTSEYSIYGAHAGFAEMMKIQFYLAFCFGTCFGGDGAGWYIGLDGSGSVGAGGGFFAEGGVDVTDLIKNSWSGKPYGIKDLYKAKAIYLGAGFDVGEGVGLSGDLFFYTHDFDLSLTKPGQKPTSETFSKIRLR
jgi:hypothetical protein